MTDIRFRVLGPLRAWRGETEVELSSGRQRNVLALLLLRAGSPVRRQEIIDAVWGDDAPASVVNLVQTYIGRLRRRLDPDRVARSGSTWLARTGTAYEIQPDRCDIDLMRFHAYATGAREAASAEESLALLLQALRLWHGPCLADLDHVMRGHPWVRAIDQEHIDTLLEAATISLELGRSGDVIPQLRAVASAEPLNEAVHAKLVLALAATGAQAEALAEYELVRARLADELGIDPGPQLRQAHLQVLRQETARPARHGAPERAALLRPSLLPPDIADFTGRAQLVERLRGLLAERGQGPVMVSLITGRGGVGKTALAVHLAHQMSAAFPDGQLYADLLGAGEHPAEPARVMTRFLRSLGIAGQAIPDDPVERADLYRTQLAGRKILVVLDNAASHEQVRPLLPGSPTCSVIVTSRSRLPSWPGAHTVDLDVFEPAQGVELLAAIIGRERVRAEPDAAAELVALCGRLPLAIRIAATKLAARPHWSLARLAERLADERRRLDELALGDLDLRASLRLSYQRLDGAARRAFRLLGLLDGPTFAPWMAATMLEAPLESAEEHIDALTDARLLDAAGIDATGQTRYRFHDLVRLYARERAVEDESGSTLTVVVTRALATLLALAQEADDRLPKAGCTRPEGRSHRWPLPAPLRERLLADPLSWFESERACLVAAVAQASSIGHDELAWELAGSLLNAAVLRSFWDELAQTHEAALSACRRAGNRLGEAVMLRGLGKLDCNLGRHERCLAARQAARDIFAALGNTAEVARLDQLIAGHSRARPLAEGIRE